MPDHASDALYGFTLRRADGTDVALSDYRGQVLLIVNTASECGFTPQYAGLETLQREFGAEGFSVLACPCNQFGRQEPGDDAAIQSFCTSRFQASFPVFAKLEVNGPAANPLFRHLRQARRGVLGTGAIKWNFTKFLVGRQGQVVARYAPTTRPEAIRDAIRREVRAAIPQPGAQA